ncbi:hypothetical protein [Nitrobacter sp.]|uniref:hypothetical protein n=1 Tax=Nitrobacter sp. TaxID=29420 RepID=UPI003F653107
MAKLANVLAAIDALGFDPARASAIARRLSEEGVIPSGGPARAPELDEDDTIRLIVAIAVTSKLRLADTESAEYLQLVPSGTILPEGAPVGIPRNAAEAVDLVVDLARRGDPDARKSSLTFVRSWPEVSIEQPSRVGRYRNPGANAGHWERDGHRTATTIPVAAVANILDELFGKAR